MNTTKRPRTETLGENLLGTRFAECSEARDSNELADRARQLGFSAEEREKLKRLYGLKARDVSASGPKPSDDQGS